jgi:sulfate permease, SulP family
MDRFEGYSWGAFRKDLIAGLIVGIIAIPLGMAFAIASGVKPEYGIYTTIVAGILISLLGGSRFQIGGPTGAFIPVLFAIVLQYGYENLLIAGLMGGVLLVLMGLCRMGSLIRFIPKPVTVGFTAGIAVIIFSGQIANFLGLREIEKHESFLLNMKEIGLHLPTWSLYSLATASICLVILIMGAKYRWKVPGSLVGLIVSSIVAALFFDGHVATIGSSFGEIPSRLPAFHLPEITWEKVHSLLQPALIIAMLGGIESLLSAVVADEMAGTKHNSNRELIGQGIANMITPLFGGIPATGAIARTATNIKNGAASPLSGVIHGLTVLLVLLVFAPWASRIPLASMAPILMMVAWNMSERKEFLRIVNMRTGESMLLLVTFGLTVLTTLTTAVGAGLALALLLFVKRMGDTNGLAKMVSGRSCPQLSMYTIEGPLFFGSSLLLEKGVTSTDLDQKSKMLLLQMGKVPYIDITGAAQLEGLVHQVSRSNGVVLLSDVAAQPYSMLEKSGVIARIGREHVYDSAEQAVASALRCADRERCRGCSHHRIGQCTLSETVNSPTA